MADVVEHDFGKQHREAARAFGRLTGLLEKQAEDFIANPSAFFAHAGDEISRRALTIQNAADALRPSVVRRSSNEIPLGPLNDTLVVPRDEYERLKACARIIRDAAAM